MRIDVMPVATEKQIVEIEETANHVWHNYYKDIFFTSADKLYAGKISFKGGAQKTDV